MEEAQVKIKRDSEWLIPICKEQNSNSYPSRLCCKLILLICGLSKRAGVTMYSAFDTDVMKHIYATKQSER